MVKRVPSGRGFEVLPRRWAVERTLAWLSRNRRLAKDFKATIATARTWLFPGNVQILLRRLTRQKNNSLFQNGHSAMGRCVCRPVAAGVSSAEERSFLEHRVLRRRVARRMSDCRRIVLRCADGSTSKVVVAELGVHEHTAGKWRRRFLKDRIEGLSDALRSGRPRSMGDARAGEVVKRTFETSPPDATHRSIRSMARKAGLSHTTARRIRKAFGLNRIGRRRSNCPAARCSWTRRGTSWVSIHIHRRRAAHWRSASMKRTGDKPSTANNRSCR